MIYDDDAGQLVDHFGNPWWLILIPLVLPPLVWSSYRSLAGPGTGPPRPGDPLPRGGDHLDRAGPGRAAVGPAVRPPGDDLPDRRLQQRARASSRRPRSTTSTEAPRSAAKDDLAGVVVFGKEPRVEVPPAPSELNLLGIESTIDPENTDLGAAVKLALATFPEDTARRIVDALRRQREPRQPVRAGAHRQVAGRAGRRSADRLLLRPRGPGREGVDPARRQEGRDGQHQRGDPGQRADAAARFRSFRRPTTTARRPSGSEQPVPIELQRGINVFTLKQLITEPNFYTFSAEFMPEKGSGDRRAINNVAEGFTHARGKAQVLLIEGTRGRARRAGQGAPRKGDRGQGPGRPQDRRLRRASAAIRCRPTWPSFNPMTA